MAAPATPGHPFATRRDLLWLLGITVAALLTFAPVLGHQFTIWDDPQYVSDNPLIQTLNGPALVRMFSSTYLFNYQPLTLLSYAIDHRIGGLDPRVYHATNLLLHLLNGMLVYWLVLSLTQRRAIAGLTALLFAVHPLQAEAVSWVSSRKDVLSAALALGASVAYLRFRGNRRPWLYVLVLALFTAACLAKSVILVLPLLLLLFDYWRAGRITWRDAAEKVPFALIAVVCAAVALVAMRNARPTAVVPTPWQHVGMISYNALFYAAKLVAPTGLSAVYPSWIVVGEPLPWTVAAAPLALAGTIMAIAVWGRRWRPLIVGPTFYIISLSPVLGFIPAGLIRAADRYGYLAAIGLFYLATAGIAAVNSRLRGRPLQRVALAVAVGVAVSALAVTARSRCLVWHDSTTLFRDVVSKYPRLELGYRNLASARIDARDDTEAVACFNALIFIRPTEPSYQYGKGCALSRLGQFDSARVCFDHALARNPDYVDARINRGALRALKQDFGGAITDYDAVLAMAPNDTDARYDRGLVELMQRRYSAAVSDFDAALRVAPGYVAAYKGRAKARLHLNDGPKAAGDLMYYTRLKPADGEGFWLLAQACRLMGDRAGYRSDSLRALQLGYQPSPPESR